ncbi:hypothetical protein BAUCODRAFT_553848 [Baudoinia panamericana UAMH 10762]|uniref:Uncharacterized protein n=1 Tax=Baudoinia panamericana (strain UAMH 10762) TaxID=717646 RepID=M2N6D6_BAUPA|nr:uncharacterized protein BAUCODRAFT_553848 [Baudoinia panamericana UAMH 10762]EMC94604.1 hypothetical protein BAUCODRAFT_553848 [Baudoinia panamericana UAMH 10762]
MHESAKVSLRVLAVYAGAEVLSTLGLSVGKPTSLAVNPQHAVIPRQPHITMVLASIVVVNQPPGAIGMAKHRLVLSMGKARVRRNLHARLEFTKADTPRPALWHAISGCKSRKDRLASQKQALQSTRCVLVRFHDSSINNDGAVG